MEPISKIISEPRKKTTERGELLRFFIDNLRDKKGKKYRAASVGFFVSHIPTKDLYYFKSVLSDILNRNGKTAMNKAFWGMLKNK